MPDRVLVIEDDPDIARLLELVLTDAGHAVELEGDATSARQRLTGSPPPALVVVEHWLPDGFGRDLTAAIKGAWPGCPVVLLSGMHPRASGAPERRRHPRGPEPDAVLPKPFDVDELLAVVRELTRRNQAA
jgi:DNA-binding response OmpR family regulator